MISSHTIANARQRNPEGLLRLSLWLRLRCYDGLPLDLAEHNLRNRLVAAGAVC